MRGLRCLLLVAVFVSLSLWAQEFRAIVSGRVTDASGAAVAQARIELINTQTNEAVQALSSDQGTYSVPLLRPGSYSLTAEAPGFKKYRRDGLSLNVGQSVAVDVSLELGTLTEQVTVTAETPLIEVSKADRGGVIDNKQVAEFPLNARNPFMLSTLVAGVAFNGTVVYQRPFDNGAIADWSINGTANRNNDFLLDGAPNNSQGGGNNIALVPSVDAVQEFKIQTNSYDAQYGHSGGGTVNVTLKSGTNRLHGSVYEFARRNAWDANSFQNNAKGAPKDGHYLDQYGFEVDGPVFIPKLIDGRNRAFFMFAYEGYREGNPVPLNLSVPEMDMRLGDFSKLVDAQGRQITIYDPATGRDVNGVWTRDPFPGNIIPADRINPIARKVLEYMPAPNTRTTNVGYSQLNYFVPGGDQVEIEKFYNLASKFDFNVSDKHRFFFRHAQNARNLERTDNGMKRVPGHQGYYPHERINYADVIDWVSTLRPTVTLNLRLSFNRFTEANQMTGNDNFDLTTLGFPSSLASQLSHGDWFGAYSFTSYIGLGRYPSVNNTNNLAFAPSVFVIKGAHTIKAGLDARAVQYNTQNYGNPLSFSATPALTQREWNRADALSGNAIASWLLGTPSGGGSDFNLFPIFLNKYYAPFIQDDWKVTRTLTLNLGLRWDFNIPPNERFDRINRGFDPAVTNDVDRLIDRNQFPGLPTVRGSLLFANAGGQPRTAADTYMAAIQPRAGFAWQPKQGFVIRGGWGRYFVNPNNDFLQTFGFSVNTPLVNSLDDGRTPIANVLNNPFPQGVQRPAGSTLGSATFLGRNLNYVNTDFKTPHVDQFSFGFQYELPWRSRIEASYAGSRTRNMQTSRSVNTYDAEFRRSCNLAEGGNPLYCDAQLPNPYRGLEPFRGTSLYTANTLTRATLAQRFPHFGTMNELMRNDGRIWYNSLQLSYETRMQHGLSLLASYTLSKMMEENGFDDLQRGIMQRSLYVWDRPHRLSVASIYELPFGPGKRFLRSTHGFWSRVVSGWENSWMIQYQSGRPWELPANLIYMKDATVQDIDWSSPRVYGVQPCVARWNDNGSITMQAFSTQAGCTDYNFLIAPRYYPRTSTHRNSALRLHAVPLADVSFNKTTLIREQMRVQFRCEIFNAFNTYHMYNALFNNNPESATFGSFDKAAVAATNSNRPRYVQLAVKFLW